MTDSMEAESFRLFLSAIDPGEAFAGMEEDRWMDGPEVLERFADCGFMPERAD